MSYLGTKEREIEAEKVKNFMGIKEISFLNIDWPIEFNEKNLKKIIKSLRNIKPDIVFCPHEDESDRDHRKTNEIVNEALWMGGISIFEEEGSPLPTNPSLLLYEVHTPIRGANYCEDISEVIGKKINALRLYKSQIKSKRYDESVKSLNRFRGIMDANTEYAEVFIIRKWQNPI